MQLSISERRAVTKKLAGAYRHAGRAEKSVMLDQLVELPGWHRDYARAQLRAFGEVRIVRARRSRTPVHSSLVVSALELIWGVARCPAAKRLAPMLSGLIPILSVLAPMLSGLVPMLRRDGDLDLSDDEAVLLMAMSPATIDRRLTGSKVLAGFRGRSHTRPGSLITPQIPIRTWSEWDDAGPGFVEIDLVGHEGGNSFGEFCFTDVPASDYS